MKWKEEKSNDFKECLLDEKSVNNLLNIINSLNGTELNESLVDHSVNELNQLLLSAGKSHYVNVSSNSKTNVSGGMWYDAECIEKRNKFKTTQYAFSVTGCEEDRLHVPV